MVKRTNGTNEQTNEESCRRTFRVENARIVKGPFAFPGWQVAIEFAQREAKTIESVTTVHAKGGHR